MSAVVEFLGGDEPVRGQVTRGGAPSEPFVGWLALLGLLERAHATAIEEPQGPRRGPTP